MNFQEMIQALLNFWSRQGCIIHQGYDLEVGAGTLNPATFLRCLGPEPYQTVYVEPSRRPGDGRYGENPNRVQFYHQMQVIIKPSPFNLQQLYLDSLKEIGIDLSKHDIRFVHDDWENPTIGAWGLGWEVWADGMEVTQFTYFQAVGGLPVDMVTGEVTYGLERLAMYVQGVDSIFDLKWNEHLTYGDIYKQNEREWSTYNFEASDGEMWHRHFDDFEREALALCEKELAIPAYDFVMKASHAFNMLDARGLLSVNERASYIARVRALAKSSALAYVKMREGLDFPLRKQEITHTFPSITKAAPKGNPQEKETFLLEIGVEELPATFVPIGMHHLKSAVCKLLEEHKLSHGKIETFGTPRRLAILIQELAGGTESKRVERKGPSQKAAFDPTGAPTKAGMGFFSSIGIEPPTLDQVQSGKHQQLELREVKGEQYLFADMEVPGICTRTLFAEKLESLICGLDFPKKMRWNTLPLEFPRPLKWLVSLYGNEVIPFTISVYVSGRTTFGHWNLAPQGIELPYADHYVERLRLAHVMVDPKERETFILKWMQKQGLRHAEESRVLHQVVHLVEWPFPLIGDFDAQYLEVPKEVLMSEMVEHQKYFPCLDPKGELEPRFVVVSNNTPTDLIKHGHEKALSPRLADGMFLFKEDLETPYPEFEKKLERVTYHAKLGSMAQKVGRLEKLALYLQKTLAISTPEQTKKAAHLCKADLVTELVGEFPELQGTIGRIYAQKHKEDSDVSAAIEEHWMPKGEKAPLPQTETGIIMALADKIDTLLTHFAIGLKPTSSSDPYALRRQALGLLKIAIEHKLSLPLQEIFQVSLKSIAEDLGSHPDKNVLEDVFAFIKQRARILLEDYGYAKEAIESVLSTHFEDPYELMLKLEALKNLNESGEILEVYNRMRKLLSSQRELPSTQKLNPSLFEQTQEKELFNLFDQHKNEVTKALKAREYPNYFEGLRRFATPTHAFFDHVKVMADQENIKINRLALVHEVKGLFDLFCDFSRL
jgi:glycyl-tRNA synthetase